MVSIARDKTTNKLPLLPYSCLVVNNSAWATYGLLLGNSALWAPAIPGLALGAFYCAVFARHCPPGASWLPLSLRHHATGVLLGLGGLTIISSMLEADSAAFCVGLFCNGLVFVQFSAPLA